VTDLRPHCLRICCLVFIAYLFKTLPAQAADNGLSIRSKNFLLVGNASESSIRRIGRELEEFRAALALIFPGVNQPSSIGTTVIVFKDDGAFRPYKPLYEGKVANIAGYFQAGGDVNFIARSQQVGIPLSLLESKVAEGRAKGVAMDRIATAVESRLGIWSKPR
jgi:hypothetical protein